MWNLAIAKRHKVLTYVILILAGAGLGAMIDYVALCAIFGILCATCLVYGRPATTSAEFGGSMQGQAYRQKGTSDAR